MADEALYKGISVHSTHFKNAVELREKGAKVSLDSALISHNNY